MTPRYSWPQFRRPFELDVEVAKPAIEPDRINTDAHRLRMDDGAWTSVELKVMLRSTETPPDGIGHLAGYVLASSPRSNSRIPIRLENTSSPAEFVGQVRLERQTLAGAVELVGHVVGYGDWGVRAVATSDPWVVVVDASDAPTPPGAPPFEVIWIEFDGDDAPPQTRSASSSYALMDTAGPKPVLFLNRSVTGLEAILNASRPREEKKRLRNLLGAQVAHYAATTLLNEAILQCDITDDIVTRPDDPILAQMLEAVAAEIDGVEGVDELVLNLRSDGATRHEARSQVDDALTSLTNFSGHVARSVEEVFRG